MRTRLVLLLYFCVTLPVCLHAIQKTILQHIHYSNTLRRTSLYIQSFNISHYYERDTITVFVPTSTAFRRFKNQAERYGYNVDVMEIMKQFLLYHIGDGVIRTADMTNEASLHTSHPDSRWLYFNVYPYGDTKIYSVNGAWITTADIEATNGVLHIIDRVIVPIQQTQTITQFLLQPKIDGLGFFSISQASSIDPALKAATDNPNNRFTVFAPNDSYIMPMPNYGQDPLFNNLTLLKNVFWAHVVENEVLFIPRLGDMPPVLAKKGVVHFTRAGDHVYVTNNRVRARVIEANIPVANGVVHVIDSLLYYVYRNFMQTIEIIPNVQFVNTTISKARYELRAKLENPEEQMTVFLPTDDAYAKLPIDKQIRLDNNATKITMMFRDHILDYAARDLNSFQDGETFFTADNKILTIHRQADDVYIEGGGVRAKIITPDIGCTNGVIHLISNVLFQRDFTIWEAIKWNPQLSEMKEFMERYPNQTAQLLSTSSMGPMTVFLTSNAAQNRLSQPARDHIRNHPEDLLHAVRGSIAPGVMLSSSQIPDHMDVGTVGGQTLDLYHNRRGVSVVGTHITAEVLLSDIWCSNGVLHITDNILHLPTRSLAEQLEFTPSLGVISNLLKDHADIRNNLGDITKTYTMFVPSDEAFHFMPASRADVLGRNRSLRTDILKSHIVPNVSRYIEEYPEYAALPAEHGVLFVVRTVEQIYAVSNNVKGDVVMPNVRCINGMIHIVDSLLSFPFYTVDEVMQEHQDLKPFYSFLAYVDEFYNWASMPDIEQTVFVPSARFLTELADNHKVALATKPGLLLKIFHGHFLPGTALRQTVLQTEYQTSRIYPVESRYNVTFNLNNTSPGPLAELSTVDVGFTNLRKTIHLVKDGTACSNGMIYVLDGFLNYPLYNLAGEIRNQENISIATGQLLKLIPSDSTINLKSSGDSYTVFATLDGALTYLSYKDINYLNSDITAEERNQIVYRHIVQGKRILYDDILNGRYSQYATDHNITVISRENGIYLRWQNVEAQIIRQNILASNGIIHVVDRMLLSTPYQTTTPPPTTTTTTPVARQVSSATQSYFSRMSIALPVVMLVIFCLR